MTRKEYLAWMKEDLDRLNALAAGWADDTRHSRIDLRHACEHQLEGLRAHRERTAARMLEAQAAPEDAWERAALDLDRAWREMREAYGVARMYFEPELRDSSFR